MVELVALGTWGVGRRLRRAAKGVGAAAGAGKAGEEGEVATWAGEGRGGRRVQAGEGEEVEGGQGRLGSQEERGFPGPGALEGGARGPAAVVGVVAMVAWLWRGARDRGVAAGTGTKAAEAVARRALAGQLQCRGKGVGKRGQEVLQKRQWKASATLLAHDLCIILVWSAFTHALEVMKESKGRPVLPPALYRQAGPCAPFGLPSSPAQAACYSVTLAAHTQPHLRPTLTHTNERVALAAVDGAGQPHEPAVDVTDLAVGAALLTHPVVTGGAVTWHLEGEVEGWGGGWGAGLRRHWR